MINDLYKELIIFILCGSFIFSCKKDNDEFSVITCSLERSIDVLPDSTFMSDAIKMQIAGNHIYFIERTSRQLIKLNTDFTINTRIGQWGMGPRDLTEPRNFFLIDDSICIMDIGSMSLKYFLPENTFAHSLKMKVFSEQRVFSHDDFLYLASYDRDLKTSISLLNLTNKENMSSFGESFDFNHSLQNIIRNKRDLLKDHEYFYTVSDNQPIIEKYDLVSKEKLESFDYSFIPIIEKNIRTIASMPDSPNSYTSFVRDSYIYDGELYLLISKQGDKFTANTILRVKLYPNFELEKTYLLPGEIYSTFCIANDSFYAFNYETAAIEKIRRD